MSLNALVDIYDDTVLLIPLVVSLRKNILQTLDQDGDGSGSHEFQTLVCHFGDGLLIIFI